MILRPLYSLVSQVCKDRIYSVGCRMLTTIYPEIFFFQNFSVSSRVSALDDHFFPGTKCRYTQKLEVLEPDQKDPIPVYRVMDNKGNVIDADEDPQVSLV